MRNCTNQDRTPPALHPSGGMRFAGLRNVVESMNQVLPGTAQGSEGDLLGNVERAFKQSLLDVKSEAQIAFAGKNVLHLIGKYDVEL